jgi:hypothetical protein
MVERSESEDLQLPRPEVIRALPGQVDATAGVTLLAFVDSELDDVVISAIQQLVADSRELRYWVTGPPEFVDYEEGGVRTVGVRLQLLAPRSTAGDPLPGAIDRALLEDVRTLVDALRTTSELHAIDIGFEMDGMSVGWIDRGVGDELLMTGLIGEWEAHLAVQTDEEGGPAIGR